MSLPPSVRVFFCLAPTDMRRSFDGLVGMTRSLLRRDPLSGHLFVFRNRRGNRLKVLYWDRTGLCIWYKRLERGVFQFPSGSSGTDVEISSAELMLILEGLDLRSTSRTKRYSRAA